MEKDINQAHRGPKTHSTYAQAARRYQKSVSTIRRWATEERFAHLNFPSPIPMGPNTELFDEDELDAYDARRMALRDQSQPKESAAAE